MLQLNYLTGILQTDFLPDKAIDLIDESAAKLRLEMNSMPEELDELERKIRQLEIEREAIKRENDEIKLKELNTEIANLSVERDTLKAKWQEEKELVEKIQNAKAEIENLKLLAEQAEREWRLWKSGRNTVWKNERTGKNYS